VQKKFFRVKARLFSLFCGSVLSFIGVSDAVCFWFVVRFNIVCGAVQHSYAWLLGMLGGAAGKEISTEEGGRPLIPSSLMLFCLIVEILWELFLFT